MIKNETINLEDIRLATELRMVHRKLMAEAIDKHNCIEVRCVEINRQLGLHDGHCIGGLIFFYNKLNEPSSK